VVSYAPDNQLQSAPTVTDAKSAARWWNGWYTAFAAFLGAFAGYIVFVVGRTSHGLTDAAPRPWNAIVLTALSLGAVLSYLAAGRLNRRRSEASFQAAVIAAIQAAAATRIRRPEDEPTVPVAGRVYTATATVKASTSADGSMMDVVMRRVDQRFDEWIEDVRRLTGVERAMDPTAGSWPDGVTPMVPHSRR
jgi:hypothetical protein